MGEMVLKTKEKAVEFFTRAFKSCKLTEIVLLHNSRKEVLAILKEAAKADDRELIEKDLTTVTENEMGAMKLDNKPPKWLKPVFECKSKKKYVVYLREFHEASPKIQDDVMNILVKREIEECCLPENTIVVVGVMPSDEMAKALTGTHVVEYLRQ